MRNNSISTEHRIIPQFAVSRRASKSKFVPVLIWFFCFAIGYPLAAQPLDIGNRRQLFVDYRFVQAERNVGLLVHKPRKTGDTCIISGSGHPSVLEKDGVYHMWYSVSSSTAYARSNDGIHWELPLLNLTTDTKVSKPNNIVFGYGAGGVNGSAQGSMVFLDPNAPDDQRFRLVANPSEFSRFIQVFSSPDGIRWKHTHRDVVTYDTTLKPHHLDTQNVIFWDTRLKKYVTYVRKNSMEPGSQQGRSVGRGESSTLTSFGQATDLLFVMRAGGREDIYTNGVFLYPWADDVYFAFPTLYYHYGKWQGEFARETPTNAGIVDTRFAVSRDGISWNNFNWHTFVPLGMGRRIRLQTYIYGLRHRPFPQRT